MGNRYASQLGSRLLGNEQTKRGREPFCVSLLLPHFASRVALISSRQPFYLRTFPTRVSSLRRSSPNDLNAFSGLSSISPSRWNKIPRFGGLTATPRQQLQSGCYQQSSGTK